ncbi:MAG: cyclic nucleotide-binding domain-containing protein [Hormoscilla sp. GUM202]|nr:cyclic nucleotide-binding domain-containing protein [Hormoscilla sp. GUM202]
MAIEIIAAKTPAHIDGIFQIRHKVFSEERGFFSPTHDGRLTDRFDAFPGTTNLAVLHEGRVVGGMRLTLDSEVGIPADDYFDFRSHIPKDSQVMGCGMYCVTKEFRTSKIALGLMLMASYFGISHGASHVAAPINPDIAKLLKRVGFQALGGEISVPHVSIPLIPLLLDGRDLKDYFMNFARENELYNFLKSYECMFFFQAEQIIRAGDPGNTAFIIVEGEAEVRYKDTILMNLKQGDMFGELALLTDEIRSADVFAKTEVKAMVLKKDDFLSHLKENPQQALKIISSIANRLKSLTNQIKS